MQKNCIGDHYTKAISGRDCHIAINNYDCSVLTRTQSRLDEWKQETCPMVYLNRQDMRSDSPNWMIPLAGTVLKMEGDHLKI